MNLLKILVLRELVNYFKELAWIKKFVISHIPDEYKSETKKKLEVRSGKFVDINLLYY